jgi:hypothetical protein
MKMILDAGYWMLDGRFPIGVALRKDARCWLDRSGNPALQGVAKHPKCHFERSEKSYNVNNNNIPTIRDR